MSETLPFFELPLEHRPTRKMTPLGVAPPAMPPPGAGRYIHVNPRVKRIVPTPIVMVGEET